MAAQTRLPALILLRATTLSIAICSSKAHISHRAGGLTLRAGALAASLVVLPAFASRAEASDARAVARDLANRAADAIAHGEVERAEALLRDAYRTYPAPTIALLRARTLVRLGRLTEAVSSYEQATATTVDATSPAAFENAVRDARTELAALRPRVPRLQVTLTDAAAGDVKVSVDGKTLSKDQLGRWLLVDPGSRSVSARRDADTKERRIRLEEGQSMVVDIALSQPSRPARWLTVGALGVGVAGLAVGVVSGVLANAASERAYAACPQGRCLENTEGARQLLKFRELRTVSTVGYVSAAAGLSFGGLLLLRGSFDGPTLDVEMDVASPTLAHGGR